jgi:hypothetical protein
MRKFRDMKTAETNFCFLIRNSRSFQKIAWEVYPLESWLPEREEKSNS